MQSVSACVRLFCVWWVCLMWWWSDFACVNIRVNSSVVACIPDWSVYIQACEILCLLLTLWRERFRVCNCVALSKQYRGLQPAGRSGDRGSVRDSSRDFLFQPLRPEQLGEPPSLPSNWYHWYLPGSWSPAYMVCFRKSSNPSYNTGTVLYNMNARVRKCLRASNVRSCSRAFRLLHVQACKLVLNHMCDSKRGHACHCASTRNFQQVCVNECSIVYRFYPWPQEALTST
jgi:hypothetical protein